MNDIQSWLTSICHYIDSIDAVMMENANLIHTKMIHWMIQVLIRLAPNLEEVSDEAKKIIYFSTAPLNQIAEVCGTLSSEIEAFTASLVSSCGLIVSYEDLNLRKIDENEDKDSYDLKVLEVDCKEWIMTAKLLLNEVMTNSKKGQLAANSRRSFGHRKSSLMNSRKVLIQESTTIDPNSVVELSENDKETEPESQLPQLPPPQLEELHLNERNQTDISIVLSQPDNTDVENQQQQQLQDEPNDDEGDGEEEAGDNEEDILQLTQQETYEILGEDKNTERRFLENIDFEQTENLSEVELKQTVFNAFQTIKSLQENLM
jgi:hypothetical protein